MDPLFKLPHGIASPEPYRRVRSWLKLDEWTLCLVIWTEALRESIDGETVASDGNILRHSLNRALPKVLSPGSVPGSTPTNLCEGLSTSMRGPVNAPPVLSV